MIRTGAPRRRAAVTAAMVVLGLLAAPGCDTEEDVAWAQAAEDWAAAEEASWESGISNAARFYAEDVEVDQRGLTGYSGIGPAGFMQSTRDNAQDTPVWLSGRDPADMITLARNEAVYVSVDALISPVTSRVAGYDIPEASYQRMSADGIQQEMFSASIQCGVEYVGMDRSATDELVARYRAAWAGSDPDATSAVYSPAARLRDSLQGVTAFSPPRIGALASSDVTHGGLPSATLHIAGSTDDIWPDVPEYYVNGPFSHTLTDRLVLLMDVPDPAGCTRAVAAVLWLDEQGLITREERLHRVDTLRECTRDATLPSGWWDEVALPEAPVVRRTGTVPGPGKVGIAVWNSTGLEPLILWALQRFADLGLPPPTPTSVTFLPEVQGDPWVTYGFLTGTDAPDIGVPITRDTACATEDCDSWTPAAKSAVLHELAHVWVPTTQYSGMPSTKASGVRAQGFLAAHDLAWHDPALPWGQQGTERAAETIAWGLMDEPYAVDARLGPLTCEELAEDFETLTYSTPDPRACAEPVDASGGHG